MFEVTNIKEVKVNIGLLVKAVRKHRGMSQGQLADTLDVSRTTIQNLELGANFTIDTLLKVLKEVDMLDQLNQKVSGRLDDIQNTKPLY